jgi:hypothetical protein
LRELEEFKYLVRFPPDKQISNTIISDTTYFKLKKEGVLVSLRAWNGDIEPYDSLEETWVQIRGVPPPPRWSKWRTFRQIASSLGKMIEIDWNSLFSSFFNMVKIKVACKDSTKIPKKRLFEMRNNLYVIDFKVEGHVDLGEDDDENGEGKDDPGQGRDNGMEEFQHDSLPDPEVLEGRGQEESSWKGNFSQPASSSNRKSGNGKVASWVSLFQNEEESLGSYASELGQYS